MNVVSLFAGIGGFDLGLERAGMRTVAHVELNDTSRAVFARHFPDSESWSDVREFAGPTDDVRCDVACGGFPCQDLSVAGRRAGLAGERSGLFFDAMRVVERLAPRWVLLENVPGLLSSHGGADMGTVLRPPTAFLTLSGSESPSDAAVCSLSDVLEANGDVPPRYFLSPTACRGILRRAEKRGRELPESLRTALQAASTKDPIATQLPPW
jgi:hypothetical protein